MSKDHTTTEHEHTLFAEQLFNIGGFPVTNGMVTSWLALFVIIALSLFVGSRIRMIPGRVQSFFELLCEQFLELCDQVTNDRAISEKAFPLAIGMFIFVLINNWMGIVPGVGSLFMTTHTGESIALLRGATADINTTLALSLFSVVASNLVGILSVGLWATLTKFVPISELFKVRQIIKNPTLIIQIPVNIFVGLLELLGEMAKVAALSFRLFGNVFAGEVLLASMSALLAYGIPVPFLFLEFFVGIIQAFIISLLTVVYITLASQVHGDAESHAH